MSDNTPQRKRNASQIEADLSATRDRLTASVRDADRPSASQPDKAAVDRRVKQLANTELENAKSQVFNARGDLRTDRLAVVGAAVAGSVSFLLIIRAMVRRVRRRA